MGTLCWKTEYGAIDRIGQQRKRSSPHASLTIVDPLWSAEYFVSKSTPVRSQEVEKLVNIQVLPKGETHQVPRSFLFWALVPFTLF